MVTKKKIKIFNSLSTKKGRETHKLFIAEGEKLVCDIFNSNLNIKHIYCTEDFIARNSDLNILGKTIVHESSLKKISNLKTPHKVVAAVELPDSKPFKFNKSELIIALDGIRDPGNMGTIIRLADWFGIKKIICSKDTVDAFNPKVVQSSMGSIAGVDIYYVNLLEYLQKAKNKNISIYGTFLEGNNIYKSELKPEGIIVMGNEGQGISKEVKKVITDKLLIPSFNNNKYAESLNVSMATAIVISQFVAHQNK